MKEHRTYDGKFYAFFVQFCGVLYIIVQPAAAQFTADTAELAGIRLLFTPTPVAPLTGDRLIRKARDGSHPLSSDNFKWTAACCISHQMIRNIRQNWHGCEM